MKVGSAALPLLSCASPLPCGTRCSLPVSSLQLEVAPTGPIVDWAPRIELKLNDTPSQCDWRWQPAAVRLRARLPLAGPSRLRAQRAPVVRGNLKSARCRANFRQPLAAVALQKLKHEFR